MYRPKIVSVDTNTVSYGDIDFSPVEALGDVSFYGVLTPAELEEAAKDADFLLVNKAEVTRALVEKCPRLKYVGTYSTGFNNVDIAALKERRIVASNVPGYSTNAVCQHVFSLMLMFAGKTDMYSASVAEGDWIKSGTFCYFPWAMTEICGKTLGIYGFGSIGRAVAKIALAMGMKVVARKRHTCAADEGVKLVDGLDELLAEADVITLHCDLNAGNAKMVNADFLSKVKKGAILINTARGGLVDEDAVAKALGDGILSGYGADVLAEEPPRHGSPLIGLKNCIITPHVAWASRDARARLLKAAKENIDAFIAGDPTNIVY